MSGFYDAPNQQVVRGDASGPVDEGEGRSDPVEGAGGEAGSIESADPGAGFDPGDHTVAEVEAYAAEYPDERAALLSAERDGKARSTLIDRLEAADE